MLSFNALYNYNRKPLISMSTKLQSKSREWIKKEYEKYFYIFLVASIIYFKCKHAFLKAVL